MTRTIAFALLIVFLVLPLEAQSPKDVFVTIRVDDIFMRESPITPQEVDSFVAVCEKHGAKVMLAVIPHRLVEDQNKDGEMARALARFVTRGHMVSLHSYRHQCSRCGSTGHEYDCPTDSIPYEQEYRELAEGKEWLERASGATVTTFVSAGTDNQLRSSTLDILRRIGIHWVTKDSITAPVFAAEIGFVPDMPEYTWDLNDSLYTPALEKAKNDFAEEAGASGHFGICLHDHFTRAGFNNGIVLKWMDEFLSFVDAFPGLRIRYVTINDYLPH